MDITSVESATLSGQSVILRADLDVSVDEQNQITDTTRIEKLIPTINLILQKGALKIAIIAHKGRPETLDQKESLMPIFNFLKSSFPEIVFVPYSPLEEFDKSINEYKNSPSRICLFENIRFYAEEEAASESLVQKLSNLGNIYVNEAFATAHREHASTFGLPKFMKTNGRGVFFGLHFCQEIRSLSHLLDNPERPFLFIISGVKEDKLAFLNDFKLIADQILIAGRLPDYLPENLSDPKLSVARLSPDKEDITIHSIESFEGILAQAKTIFLSGPVGKFEEEGHMLGTKRIFQAVAASGAVKIAAGGDTIKALKQLNLEASFNWISIGGGATLHFLAKKTLPAVTL